MSRARRWLLVLPLAAALAGPSVAAPAQAHGRPDVAVSLGDSYISGVAGRWNGNSADPAGSRANTDRAWDPATGSYDPARIYGATATGCQRSDVAPIVSARLPRLRPVNLACGGARTANVLRASAGGTGFQGEAPQNDQLAALARTADVRLVVLSIGGNDLGFGSIVGACVLGYAFQSGPCRDTQQPLIEQRLPVMAAAVGRTLDDVHATLAAAGQRRGSYRVILQSYPSPSPRAADLRYPGTERLTVGGCPFYDTDVDWTRDWLTPRISSALAGAARAHGAQFLDLTGAFRGHELCSDRARQSDGTPTSAESEWVRFVDLAGTQGGSGDAIHPNRFGQQAMGRCLALATRTRHDVACHAVPRLPSWAMYLTPARR